MIPARSIIGFAILILATSVSAALIHVPADQPTVAAGLAAASAGDTVELACMVFNEWNLMMPDGVTLRSATGDPVCATIDAGTLGWGIQCNACGSQTRIEGITFTRGSSSSLPGGGLAVIGGSPTIDHCVFENCQDNSGHGGGGAALTTGSSAQILSCEFRSNMSLGGPGAGMLLDASAPTLDGCLFLGNNSFGGGGGGLAVVNGTTAGVSNCRFEGNSESGGPGGGVYVAESTSIFSVCEIVGNFSYGGGGGGVSIFGGAPQFYLCLLASNESNGSGGAGMFIALGATVPLNNCDFVANKCNGSGGGAGIKAVGPITTPMLLNCILAFGIGGEAVDCMNNASLTSLCSDVYSNSGGDYVGCLAGMEGVDGNFTADPLFCDLAGGDFHLCADSPCSDTGGCGPLVGAYDVACAACGSVATEMTDWGRVKRSY